MRKDKLYLLTFLSLSIIFLIISSVAIRYFVNEAADKVLETQLEFSKREAKQVATLIGNQLANNNSKDDVIKSIQKSLENTDLGFGFISVFDWSGKIICHPDVKLRGQTISSKKSFISSVTEEISSKDLYELIQDDKQDLNSDYNENSQVIFLSPVTNSDWIIGAHANTEKISQHINTLKSNFRNILLIMGFLFILSSVVIVRVIGSNYEKKLELKNEKLSDEIINLSKLNSALDSYQKQLSDSNVIENDEDLDSSSKKRILTYLRNELLPVSTTDIAYIYTDTGITYVICNDGKRTVSNSSLDELITNLDSNYFFRANRQFIIGISAIDKIVKYGNSQLKILIRPNSEVDILISKNKASEFKKWLNL
ncbi:MAG: LytTR family transcriptional regulator [Winogradskyella sp.]|uniref:LytTR family transcriptional regulator n=1 Tax=Winogradskyella sp. TaxID=1883156 RepID=UPI000F3D9FC3|nr:LytTR family transcriptional regulator [Winogradskyella sp.]RNC88280.1 MAG: LytTR family transcriptional regulator [Winogradskyella sp.]